MNKTRRFLFLFILLAMVLIIPLKVSAFRIEKESQIKISADQIVKDNVYALAGDIVVEGEIDGDLICVTKNLVIKGKVNGDVLCATKNLSMKGEITGDLRTVATDKSSISGRVGGNTNILTTKLSFPKLASIGRSLLVFAKEAEINGAVKGNVDGILTQANVAGHIGGNLNLNIEGDSSANPISINDQAYIGGEVNYNSFNKKISISKEAYINGRVNHQFKIAKKKNSSPFDGSWFYTLVVCLIFGVLITGFWKDRSREITKIMSERAGKSFAWGILFFFLIPIAFVILFVTLIGIPLAILLAILWFVFLIITKVFAGIWLGEKLFAKLKFQENNLILAAVCGIILIKVVFAIPVLGILLGLAAILWGTGAIWLSFRRKKVSIKRASKKTTKKRKTSKKTTKK